MLNCTQVTELSSQKRETPLPLSKRIAMRLHLIICDRCRRYEQQLNFIHQACNHLQNKAEQHGEGLSETSKKRIKETLSDAKTPQ